MSIRKATLKDIDILIKLRLDFLIDFDHLNAEEETQIVSHLKNYYPKHMDEDFLAIFAEEDNQVVSAAFLVLIEKPASRAFIAGKTGYLLN